VKPGDVTVVVFPLPEQRADESRVGRGLGMAADVEAALRHQRAG